MSAGLGDSPACGLAAALGGSVVAGTVAELDELVDRLPLVDVAEVDGCEVVADGEEVVRVPAGPAAPVEDPGVDEPGVEEPGVDEPGSAAEVCCVPAVSECADVVPDEAGALVVDVVAGAVVLGGDTTGGAMPGCRPAPKATPTELPGAGFRLAAPVLL